MKRLNDMELLKTMCAIHAPSGNEKPMSDFVLNYVLQNQSKWKVKPKIHAGEGFQDCIILAFGKPKTAIFAHLDSIGFTVRYEKQLIKIGGPRIIQGIDLVGKDEKGSISCKLKVDKMQNLSYSFKRNIDRGTDLTFKPNWREDNQYVQCCYMDNRLGVYNALKVAESLENGLICFTCWEEHGGGSAEFIGKFIHKKYKVKQALISDITWITEGVHHGKGVVISMRDSGIPRRSYIDKIISIAKESKIPYQLEVEASGGSDGNALQRSPYPFDWCFVGAPEDHVHSPDEKVHKKDIDAMIKLYDVLMKKL